MARQRTFLPDSLVVDACDKIDIRLLRKSAGRVPAGLRPCTSGRRSVLSLAKKFYPPEPTDIPVALSSNGMAEIFRFRHSTLAQSRNAVIKSEFALRRTREGSAFARNSVPPIRGDLPFRVPHDHVTRKTGDAKSCIMNTCTKMVGGRGVITGSYRERMENSVVANREAKPHGLISLHKNAKQLPWNDILAEKHRGAGGASTGTLTRPAVSWG